jgi:hypothetical protein
MEPMPCHASGACPGEWVVLHRLAITRLATLQEASRVRARAGARRALTRRGKSESRIT